MFRYINVKSKSRIEFIDITEMVQEVLKEAGVRRGFAIYMFRIQLQGSQ